MKRKGPKSIPDFSGKRKPMQKPDAQSEKPTVAPPPRTPSIKPQATSAKFGRRGQ